jgi:hypothetical protein
LLQLRNFLRLLLDFGVFLLQLLIQTLDGRQRDAAFKPNAA